MFSNKENINILISLLRQKGVSHAVVCPGSRNAPIVHDLAQVMNCIPVTDERSAGFYAIGLAQATGQPTVVCVTSGSALLNVAPAAAEAFYQHIPIIIISADRPRRWIDQQDGQTMWQAGALEKFVRKTVDLPEDASAQEEHWHCNRLVNEALLAATGFVPGPVHINVPLAEPLYEFTTPKLPHETLTESLPKLRQDVPTEVLKRLIAADRPMVVVGQIAQHETQQAFCLNVIRDHLVVLSERLTFSQSYPFDAALPTTNADIEACAPDFVLYMGGTLVSKRLRQFLRKCHPKEIWEVNAEGKPHATFMQQTGIIACEPEEVLMFLHGFTRSFQPTQTQTDFFELWRKRIDAFRYKLRYQELPLPFSQMSVVKAFENQLAERPDCYEHYANSSAVRLGNLFACKQIWCNRGINGIEGCLSTAAGFSLAIRRDVFCVIGDLAFFYDQNALWCNRLKGNLRILLLNNGGGGIFQKFPIDPEDKSFPYIIGANNRSAKYTCQQNHVDYITAYTQAGLSRALREFFTRPVDRAIVLEVFTDAENDAKAWEVLESEK